MTTRTNREHHTWGANLKRQRQTAVPSTAKPAKPPPPVAIERPSERSNKRHKKQKHSPGPPPTQRERRVGKTPTHNKPNIPRGSSGAPAGSSLAVRARAILARALYLRRRHRRTMRQGLERLVRVLVFFAAALVAAAAAAAVVFRHRRR